MSNDKFDPDKIVQSAPYGQHIALTCKNHPELRWSTKNIRPIGCRSIFFDDWDTKTNKLLRECSCSLYDLIPLETEETHFAR